MAEQAELDGIGMEAAFNAAFLSGLKNMERPADVKAVDSQSWPERNGREYILTDKLDDYDVSLECVVQGDTTAEAITNKDALILALNPLVIHTLHVISTNKTYNIKYNKTTGFDFLQTSTGYGIKMTLDLTVLVGVDQVINTLILDGNGN